MPSNAATSDRSGNLFLDRATAVACPIKPIISLTNDDGGGVQLAAELGELSIAAIEQGTGLTVGCVVLIDQGCELRNLILQWRVVGPCRRRPSPRWMEITTLLLAQLGENLWVISIDCVAGYPGQSAELRDRFALGGVSLVPFENPERFGKACGGSRRSIWMNCMHISLSWEYQGSSRSWRLS
jgi:hypothetical protein